MSKRFSLFYAGFTAYIPSRYYRQEVLLSEFKDCIPELKEKWENIVDGVKDLQPESESFLKVAESIGAAFQVQLQNEIEPDYSDWLHRYTNCFENEFPIHKVDYYYFLFARKLAEIVANVSVVRCCIGLHALTELKTGLEETIRNNLTDTRLILNHLTACVTILAGESRQVYFESYYRFLLAQFEALLKTHTVSIGEDKLLQLDRDLDKFYCELMNGFKKCIGLLKGLGI